MEHVPMRIKNEQEVIRQLLNLYGSNDPVAALKEYISNAVDARRPGHPMCVYISLDRNNKEVLVGDNGAGMNYEKLKSLPQSLGDSSSKGDPTKRGEKALGMLAFGGFGDRATIVSRTNGRDQYGALYLDGEKLKASAELLRNDVAVNCMGITFQTGSLVRISGVDKSTFDHYFQPERLRAVLQEMYDPLLRRGELQLYIHSKGTNAKKIELQPVHHEGMIVLERIVQTNEPIIKLLDDTRIKGTSCMGIWLDPSASNAKVATYNKGVRVLGSITQLREFNHFPWNSGKLSGYIDENWCELVPQRDGYMRDTEKRGDKKFATLTELIKSLEPQLAQKVREADKQEHDMKKAAAVKELEEALAETYKNCPPLWKVVTVDPQPPKPNVETTTVTPVTPRPKPETKKTVQITTEPQRKTPYLIDIVEFPLDKQSWYSEFDPTYKKILINSAHPEYEHFANDEQQAWIYFAKLVSSEAALGDFLLSKHNGHSMTSGDQIEIGRRATAVFLRMLEQLSFGKTKK